ncbi:GGDEF domain-containing protein [Paenibacillus sp. N1-5-1-14]|uniref:GGDEF domain-containing protein n=1 Tax=Paenibacillus radicibacter TaxID=2972488 RepID=UPI002158BA0F|nr:GGDEF domain-containing protein [Paenibacillus radicibacter]MCR8643520.1 GGDEF domain-containing protein [Paenibacillus radicibacter]
MTSKFLLDVDFDSQVLSWQIRGDLTIQDIAEFIPQVHEKVLHLRKGAIKLLIDNRLMMKNGKPYVFRPEVNVMWEQLMLFLRDYVEKCAVLCNGPIMEMQVDRLARKANMDHSYRLFWHENTFYSKQLAYKFLGIYSNRLLDDQGVDVHHTYDELIYMDDSCGMFILDSAGMVTFSNQILKDLFNLREDTNPLTFSSIMDSDERTEVYNYIELVMNGFSQHFEITINKSPRASRILHIAMVPIRNNHLVTSIYGIVVDITDDRYEQDYMRHIAYHDPLTNLPNRLKFQERLNKELTNPDGEPTELALLYLDLDGFKRVNDTCGHTQGDEMLKAAADRLLHYTRDTDLVARIGGDEFVILLTNMPKRETVARIADRIISSFTTDPLLIKGEDSGIRVSIGIAGAPSDGNDADSLIKHADLALYRAKEKGKGYFEFYS